MTDVQLANQLRGTAHATALALSHFCPCLEFPATLGPEKAPLTTHGLIGDDGMITARGRTVWALIEGR